MFDFRMPALGADMEAGTLTEWLVKPGDSVRRGQVIALVETEKGIVEIEIWQAGVVARLLVPPGTKVPVGTALAALDALEEAGRPQAPVPAAAPAARSLASPAARRRARELGVDLASLPGTGPHGAISIADIERAASAKPAAEAAAAVAEAKGAPDEVAEEKADRGMAMRRAIAAAMARSKREIPHYYLATDIDMSRALSWLSAENLRRPVTERLLPAALLLKAVALALRAAPDLNGLWVDGALRPAEATHIGVAISLRGGGLVAPAVHDVDKKTLGELMANLLDLTRRARSGALKSSEMTDPTITVTSMGDQGVEVVYGVIYPPQVALVGLGKVTERPWAAGGTLGARPALTATLSADHRASDGHRGGLFLAALKRLLQEPSML